MLKITGSFTPYPILLNQVCIDWTPFQWSTDQKLLRVSYYEAFQNWAQFFNFLFERINTGNLINNHIEN